MNIFSDLFRLHPIKASRGLLKWGDLAAVEDAMKKRGGIQVSGGTVRELPGGIHITPPANATGTTQPLTPVVSTNSGGQEIITVTPGLVFGGTGWMEPLIGDPSGVSIFNATAPYLLGAPYKVWLKLTLLPFNAHSTFTTGGATYENYRVPYATQIVAASIVGTANGSDPTNVPATGTRTGSGLMDQTFVVDSSGVYYLLLGRRLVNSTTGAVTYPRVNSDIRTAGKSGHVLVRFDEVESLVSGTTYNFAIVATGFNSWPHL